MDLKDRVEELDSIHGKVKDLYKEAGWRKRNFPFIAKYDKVFNEKASSLEEEVNSKIRGLEGELGLYSKPGDVACHLTLALKTEDYKDRFDFRPNLNNFGRKLCYGMSGGFGGFMMALKDSGSGYPSIGLTALGLLMGFATSFFMEGYTMITNHWEESSAIKDRIKDIKREFKLIKK